MNNRIYMGLRNSIERYRHLIHCVNESQKQHNKNEWTQLTDKISATCQRELDHLIPMVEMLNLKYKHKIKYPIKTD